MAPLRLRDGEPVPGARRYGLARRRIRMSIASLPLFDFNRY